jgi:hypothetical protein
MGRGQRGLWGVAREGRLPAGARRPADLPVRLPNMASTGLRLCYTDDTPIWWLYAKITPKERIIQPGYRAIQGSTDKDWELRAKSQVLLFGIS